MMISEKKPTEIISLDKRTEEITDIIERMPNTFAKNITLVVCFIVILLVSFGYIIKYPDIITGQLTINADQAPLRLVTEINGKLRLNGIKSLEKVKAGQVIGWIDNATDPHLISEIRTQISKLNLPTDDAYNIYNNLYKNKNLGDITAPYTNFLSALKQLADYQHNRLYDKQEQALYGILNEQTQALTVLKNKESISKENLTLSDRMYERDSILFNRKVISLSEFEKSKASYLGSNDYFQTSIRNTGSIREQIQGTEKNIQEIKVNKSERELQLNLEVLTSYNNLIDKLNNWEKLYLFRAPFDGKIQFLKFWNDNQFVQQGEHLFSIVPSQNNLIGQVMLPVNGAGKVKSGQNVIVKLADYPYMEFGYIKAIVNNIDLVSNSTKTADGDIETYLVTLHFPKGLTTNYGSNLEFRYESKGVAEIITKDRRLIERFFDNLKYIAQPQN